jgi:phenylalanyl-tRNA synthetase beta chain
MGGANSEVSEKTTSILIEAANFKPENIRHTGNALGLPSEARYRFERGISPGLTLVAMKRATQLVASLGGGRIAEGYIDLYPGKKIDKPISLSLAKLRRFLGVDFFEEQVVGTLVPWFECKKASDLDSGVFLLAQRHCPGSRFD